jgi:hypothetical protein
LCAKGRACFGETSRWQYILRNAEVSVAFTASGLRRIVMATQHGIRSTRCIQWKNDSTVGYALAIYYTRIRYTMKSTNEDALVWRCIVYTSYSK